MTVPDERQSAPVTGPRASPWIAFRHKTFRVVWTATVVANVGTWMYNAASGWLMTSLDADPLTVSLVQVASSLPMFLFALPAGALADTSINAATYTSSFQYSLTSYLRTSSTQVVSSPCRGISRL
jgi:hypothetical protein